MVELAEIFRDAGPAYLQRFGDRMLPSHKRVMRDIIDCRTPALGGQMYFCPRCELEHSVYHSCRDRHCPKCQGHEAERWLEKQRKLLLPCEYGFATCTVPAGLREVIAVSPAHGVPDPHAGGRPRLARGGRRTADSSAV